MVNFEVPVDLGIGITRGAATRLASGDLTLDYSGRPLNLAARLMDLARPRGVVFANSLLTGVSLPQATAEQFLHEVVYVRGMHDTTPLEVFVSGSVQVPARNRSPLDGTSFESPVDVEKFSQFEQRAPEFVHRPPVEPLDPRTVELVVSWPVMTKSGAKSSSLRRTNGWMPIEVKKVASGWELTYDYGDIVRAMKGVGIKSTWEVRAFLRYLAPTPSEGRP